MSLMYRIGIDLQAKMSLESAVEWAIDNGISYVQAELDVAPNNMDRFDQTACDTIRTRCEAHGIHLGLHTLSGVNTAEISPFVSEAVDKYLQTYSDLAVQLNAEWVVVHGGYHFGDRERRMHASLERLKRTVAYAEKVGIKLLLENLNREPELAEVQYLPHTVEECLYYFDQIDSPHLGWSYTINHATLEPEGIDGFIERLPIDRCGEVRLADNHGKYEAHLFPGEGIIDFANTFDLLEKAGFKNHYMCNFGSPDEMLRGRKVIGELVNCHE